MALALSERIGIASHWSAAEGAGVRAVLAVKEDRQGNLWAAVDHGGRRIEYHGFATFSAAEGIGDRSITDLLERDGVICAVSNEGSSVDLHRYRDGRFRHRASATSGVDPLFRMGVEPERRLTARANCGSRPARAPCCLREQPFEHQHRAEGRLHGA